MTGQDHDAFWELSILKYSYIKIMLKNKDVSIKDIYFNVNQILQFQFILVA